MSKDALSELSREPDDMEDDEVCCVLRWHGLCPVHGMDERVHKHMVEELKQLRADHLASGEAAEGLAEAAKTVLAWNADDPQNITGNFAVAMEALSDSVDAYAKAKEGRRDTDTK